MIPILYESTETAFTSNGLGRLVECISCEVTEERNGVYECEFEYPISGRFCNEMMENGGAISVTHDDNGDRQAFDIYKYSAPIDGVVTFNAHHISYRLNGVIVTPFSANTCANALQGIKSHSANTNPFTFTTDKSVTAPYVVATPSNARGILAGKSGSILDIYGTGEYKFDMFNVGLYLHRGTDTDVQIRYGKNLTDITSVLDKSGTFNAIAPYWTNGEATVTLPEVYIAIAGATNIYCVPVDLTADFETKPTAGELRADANRYLSTINPNVPDENITIDFEALWQTTDYENVAALERVGLCDTVSIYFEALGVTQAQAKIIKVVYDVLRERYKSMEFGKVQTTLAEAVLGQSANSLQDLSAGQVIGASIITAAIIKSATARFAEIYVGGQGYNPGNIYLQTQSDETRGTISYSGLSFEAGGQDFSAFSANSKKANFEFGPQDEGSLYPLKNTLSLETIEDNYSEYWDAFEQAYGEIQVARVKVDNGAATQADKIIINSKNGARIELYDASGTGLLTQIVPRIFKQLFPNGNTATELGNDSNGSHLKLNSPNGTNVINLDTQNGSIFGNGVSVTGGTNTDTLSASGNATVGGTLGVTGAATLSGNTTVGGDLDVSGDETVGGTLGVTGATTLADATVNGYLDVTTRRASAYLTEQGWYRVLTITYPNAAYAVGAGGIQIDLIINRSVGQTNNETHRITLELALYNIGFVNEYSLSNYFGITKIRYNVNTTGPYYYGYVDIYYDLAVSNPVFVDFNVYAESLIKAAITAGTLQGVAPSPANETMLAVYTFAANTITDISNSFTLNTSGITGLTGKIHALYDASSGLVHLNFSAYAATTFGQRTPIYTCSNSRYVPKATTYGNGMIRLYNGEWYPYEVGIGTTGNIFQNLTGDATRVYGQITYPV